MTKIKRPGVPVDNTEFWKNRIAGAPQDENFYVSVFNTSQDVWINILNEHMKIINELIDTKKDMVLDAGCGYGRMAPYFDNYVGLDFSPDFIDIAKHNYKDKDFMVGNLKDLPFKDNHFDWSFCISMKRMIVDCTGKEEWNLMETELKRVSKKVLILEYTDPIEGNPTFAHKYEVVEGDE